MIEQSKSTLRALGRGWLCSLLLGTSAILAGCGEFDPGVWDSPPAYQTPDYMWQIQDDYNR